MQTEFVRNLNCNYERILLEEKPEEKRYQYCILNRGGIKGLLSCSLRYIDGSAYLYYDISSKQNIKQLYGGRSINRVWVKDFMWSFRQIEQELGRFLLDRKNILWNPEQIYQDPESNVFSFLYLPYYEGDNGFKQLLDYWVEQIDYNDEALVDCVYRMYEQYERSGDVYLQAKIYEDAGRLEEAAMPQRTAGQRRAAETAPSLEPDGENAPALGGNGRLPFGNARRYAAAPQDSGDIRRYAKAAQDSAEDVRPYIQNGRPSAVDAQKGAETEETSEQDRKKRFFGLFDGKITSRISRKREREIRESYRESMQENMGGYAVAEDTVYDEEYGKTIYIEGPAEQDREKRELCTPDGRILAVLDRPITTIGKRKEEADLVLEDVSVSRLHARIIREKEKYYIEDLNSTNGTFKNGLRLQPYERRELEPEDEIKAGRVLTVFR